MSGCGECEVVFIVELNRETAKSKNTCQTRMFGQARRGPERVLGIDFAAVRRSQLVLSAVVMSFLFFTGVFDNQGTRK